MTICSPKTNQNEKTAMRQVLCYFINKEKKRVEQIRFPFIIDYYLIILTR
jgi:hypothetical protein